MTFIPVMQTGFEHGSLYCSAKGGGVDPTITSVEKHTGTYAVKCANVADSWMHWILSSDLTDLYMSVWLYTSDECNGPKFWFTDARAGDFIVFKLIGHTWKVYINAGLAATGTENVDYNTWTHLQIHLTIDDAVGVIQTIVDNVPDIDTVEDTKPGAISSLHSVEIENGTAIDFYFDDICIGFQDWPGDRRFELLTPVSDTATVEWSTSAGVDHRALIDEVPYSELDYIYSEVDAQHDQFNMSDWNGLGKIPQSITVWMAAKKSAAVDNQVFIDESDGVDTTTSSGLALDTTTELIPYDFLKAPDGSDWDETAINALILGLTSYVPPVTYLRDLFTDANGTALTAHTPDSVWNAAPWTNPDAQGFDVQTNKASATDGASNVVKKTIIDLDVADIELTAEVTTHNNGDVRNDGLFFRWDDISNYWQLSLKFGVGLALEKVVGGAAASLVGSLFFTKVDNTAYSIGVRIVGDGILFYIKAPDNTYHYCYKKDSFNQLKENVGLLGASRAGGHTRVDNILVTEPAAMPSIVDNVILSFDADADNLRMDTLAKPTVDGNAVAFVDDLSGLGHRMQPDLIGRKPTYLVDGWMAGKDALNFAGDAGSQNLTFDIIEVDNVVGLTVGFVWYCNDEGIASSHDDPFRLTSLAGNLVDRFGIFGYHAGVLDPFGYYYLYIMVGGVQTVNVSLDFARSANWHLFVCSYDMSGAVNNVRARVDKGVTKDLTVSSAAWTTDGGYGSFGSALSGNYPHKSKFANFKILNRASNLAQLIALENELWP